MPSYPSRDPRKTLSPREFLPEQTVQFMSVQSSCNGKVRYSKRGHAESQLLKMAKGKMRRTSHNMEEMQAYHCKFCLGFHTGHRSS